MSSKSKKVLEIIKKHISLGQSDINQLKQDFEALYIKFSSEQELKVESQMIEHTPYFRICSPGARQDCAVLFFHGGGFTISSTRDHMDLCGKLSLSSGVCLLSIDYWLAPEHVFPAAVEDCLDSYLWLLERGIDPSRIVLAGISAGGTLVLSTLLSLRNMGLDFPATGVCMSPAVNMLFQGDSVKTSQGKDWITPERLYSLRKVYLLGQDPKQPLASPLYADLHGLPPLMI